VHQLRVTPTELLNITSITPEALKSMRRRDQIALAFSGDDITASRMYAGIDATAPMLSATLARTYGAGMAASLVRGFGNVVLLVVAEAEASTLGGTTDVAFSVIDLVNDDGRRAYLCSGDAELANSQAAQGFVAERITTINFTKIIRAVRDGGARLGLDLSAPFLPAPDSVEFAEVMQLYDPEVMGLVVEQKALKRRDMLARKIGAQVRARAMGGAAGRKMRGQNPEVAATAV
jgi:hypothetical protein